MTKEKSILLRAGRRLNREGLSKRVHDLVTEYCQKYPDGHNKEAIALAGRLHAIFLAAEFDEYWQEKSRTAYYNEVNYLRQCQVEELEARDV